MRLARTGSLSHSPAALGGLSLVPVSQYCGARKWLFRQLAFESVHQGQSSPKDWQVHKDRCLCHHQARSYRSIYTVSDNRVVVSVPVVKKSTLCVEILTGEAEVDGGRSCWSFFAECAGIPSPDRAAARVRAIARRHQMIRMQIGQHFGRSGINLRQRLPVQPNILADQIAPPAGGSPPALS